MEAEMRKQSTITEVISLHYNKWIPFFKYLHI